MKTKFNTEQEWLEARKKYVTSTEVGALFGVSEWGTPFDLWHRKQGELKSSFKETTRTKWGRKMEAVIALAVEEKYGLENLARYDMFHTNELLKLGASYDYAAGKTLIECKNVDGMIFREKYVFEGSTLLELPLNYELQVQVQLMLSDFERVIVGVFVGGNQLFTIERKPDPKVHEAIAKKVREFWEMERPPLPDFERDYDAINAIYTQSESKKEVFEIDLELEELLSAYSVVQKIEANAAKGKEAVKAEILNRIKSGTHAKNESFSLSRVFVKPAEITYTRPGYMTFKVTKRGR